MSLLLWIISLLTAVPSHCVIDKKNPPLPGQHSTAFTNCMTSYIINDEAYLVKEWKLLVSNGSKHTLTT
jgi:hypothetical protein